MVIVQTQESLVRNLKDAGCESETIELFLQMQEDGKTADQLRLLAEHRKERLDEIHKMQAQFACVDEIFVSLKKGDSHVSV